MCARTLGYVSVSGSALKASIMESFTSVFVLTSYFLSARYFFFTHCCLLIFPLMVTDTKQSISQLMTPFRHCQSPEKQISKCYCMPLMASFSYVFGLYKREIYKKSKWRIFFVGIFNTYITLEPVVTNRVKYCW